MNAARDLDPIPLDERQQDDSLEPIVPQPSLDDLSPESSGRIVRYIVTSSLEHGVAPTAVVALYADLAGDELAVRYAAAQRQRSIFDDPEDLDALEDEEALDAFHDRLADREPDLIDLDAEAQQRIRRFAIEERLERGLPPVELLDLYRHLDLAGDLRAQQYLDRVYVEQAPPPDWRDLQSEAGRLVDMAEARGRDAGRLFADLLRASPSLDSMAALQILLERLIFQRG